VLAKAHFWQLHRAHAMSAEQINVLNRLLDGGERGFEGGISDAPPSIRPRPRLPKLPRLAIWAIFLKRAASRGFLVLAYRPPPSQSRCE